MFHDVLELESAHLQELVLMRIPTYHVSQTIDIAILMRVKGPHNYAVTTIGLVCEVALTNVQD